MGGPANHPFLRSCSRCVNRCYSGSTIAMRDVSASYWFNVGDAVRVVDDVIKANMNLKGRCGVVRETWAKCDIDPTCCCAEQVDLGMAVRVEFVGSETSDADEGSFPHYFAEEELIQVKEEEQQRGATKLSTIDSNDDMPFDGKTCNAFKLDQLKMGEQAKRIAAFQESSRPPDEN